MMRELQPKLFKRAIEIAGDAHKLCTKLHVDAHALQLWMDGRATPPSWILHALIDLIVDDDLARAAQDRRREPRYQKPSEPGEQDRGDAVSGPRSS